MSKVTNAFNYEASRTWRLGYWFHLYIPLTRNPYSLGCEVGEMNQWWLKLIKGCFSSLVDSSLFLYYLLPGIFTFRYHLFFSFYKGFASNIEQSSHLRFFFPFSKEEVCLIWFVCLFFNFLSLNSKFLQN